ncbi:MAG TPA: GNAT family N-acetyltransferase [Longimicrobiales bacterium]|nr:GNAT family N-acetyltransferase [Longimicrobiales bacterium]
MAAHGRPVLELPVLDRITRRRLEQARESRLVAIVRDDGLYVRRAEPADAQELHELLEQFVAPGMLIPRTLKQVYQSIRDFIVVVDRGRIAGAGALRIYSAELAEIGALAVAEDRQGTGLGGRIVETLVHDARALGLHRVFALTLRDRFFHRLGFETVPIGTFPEKVAADCAGCARRAACNEIAVAMTLQIDHPE